MTFKIQLNYIYIPGFTDFNVVVNIDLDTGISTGFQDYVIS